MFRTIPQLIKQSVAAFIADDALSHGAAIAYYTVFAIAPVLLIAIAIAGLVFGHEAAQGAIVGELSGLMGRQSAEAVQGMLQSVNAANASTLATVIGLATLLITASGVFGEMQTSLNVIWKAAPRSSTVSRLIRARIVSLGLVMTLGFLLTVSLALSAALAALGTYLNGKFPGISVVLEIVNFVVSFALTALLFAAIYKFLPDTPIAWRDVIFGAIVTALLFTVGKSLIGLYIGSSNVATSYGAAGALIIILLWVYYSAEIFLLGAEFTKCWAHDRGSKTELGVPTPIEPGPRELRVASPAADSATSAVARDAGLLIAGLGALLLVSTLIRDLRRR